MKKKRMVFPVPIFMKLPEVFNSIMFRSLMPSFTNVRK
jgi:hypothetical protein